jgi:amino-acid N-acetyltransferase
MRIEKAALADVPQMHRLINYFADRGEMGPRSMNEIYENIRDFSVAKEGEEVVGCTALHIKGADFALLRSGAVAEAWQGRGIGTALIEACLEEARSLGLSRIVAITSKLPLAHKLGFRELDAKILLREL